MPIDLIPIPAFKDNYIWLMRSHNQQYAAIVDPGDAAPVLEALKQYQATLSAILITHHHWDHTNGINQLLEHYSVPVFGPANETIPGLTHPLKENDHIELPNLSLDLQVLDIPGHTKGHIAYYNQDSLFCGDTLFTAGCGRLFEGTAEQMLNSLTKLAALPGNTRVYCGHEYTQNNLGFAKAVEPENPDIAQRIAQVANLRAQNLPTVPSTIEEEKRTNPFLRCDIPAVINAVEQYAGHKLKNPVEVFVSLRKWKDGFGG